MADNYELRSLKFGFPGLQLCIKVEADKVCEKPGEAY